MTVKQVFNTNAELDYPTVLPTLDLDFANSKTLDPRITFTRASGGSYVGADGLIKYAGVNEARFDHDPETGESLGLLIEEGRTNLVTGPGSSFGYLFAGNNNPLENDISPDGNVVPCKYNLIGATIPFLNVRLPALSPGIYTMSMWLKLDIDNYFANFAVVAEPQTEIYATLIKLTTSWKRYFFTFTLLNNIPAGRLQLFFERQGENRKVSVWGAQLESGEFATSYIPRKENQQSTRAADSASITGKNFSDFYNPSEGTIFSEAKGITIFNVNTRRYWEITSGSIENRLLSGYANSTQTRFLVVRDGLSSADIASSNQNLNSYTKSISTFGNNYYRIFSNGILGQIDNFGNLPSGLMNSLLLGRDAPISEGTVLNGTIKRFTYFPKRLPDEQLQALTR